MRVVGKRREGSGDRNGLDALVLKFGGGAKKLSRTRYGSTTSLEGLLRMKEHGRLKDQADAEAIRKVLGSTSDG